MSDSYKERQLQQQLDRKERLVAVLSWSLMFCAPVVLYTLLRGML